MLLDARVERNSGRRRRRTRGIKKGWGFYVNVNAGLGRRKFYTDTKATGGRGYLSY